ncbi:MAG TPA: polysaccharide deacetylase family protein [Polyangiaceae bacterium]|nr:polysaccharide deacetylase family protein [Polyangiaceae bacterium]
MTMRDAFSLHHGNRTGHVLARALILAPLALAGAVGCGDPSTPGGSSSSAGASSGGTSSGTGGKAGTSSGGATSTGGASTGGASSGGASSGGASSGGASSGGACAAPSAAVTTPNRTVKNWNGHKGAVSFTIDDAYGSALDVVVPALKQRNIVGTFYVICNNVASRVADWKAAAMAGNEVTNHTMSHAPASNGNLAELTDCDAYIKTNLGVTSNSFAYPLSNVADPYKSYTTANYIGGRGGSTAPPALVRMTDNPDWSNISADYTGGGEYGTLAKDAINSGIDASVSQDAWYVITTHSILPENNFAGIPAADYEAELDHAIASGAWIGTFAQVAAYARAQKTLTAAVMGGGTTWTWTAAAGTPDGTTLRVVIDGGSLTQGGTALQWNCDGGYYPVDVKTGELTWSP